MLQASGTPIQSYHFSNTCMRRIMLSLEIQHPTIEPSAWITPASDPRDSHGLGDFRKPSIQIQHGATEVTDSSMSEPISTSSVRGVRSSEPSLSRSGWKPWPWSSEDDQAALRLTPYYTAYEDRAAITSFSKIRNCSDETVVIHKALSVMADVPAGDYDVITPSRPLMRRKTVRRQPKWEQGIFSIQLQPVVLLDMPRPSSHSA